MANASKTGFLVFKRFASKDPPISIKVGNAMVTESDSEKVLGLRVSSAMGWREHVLGQGGVLSTIYQRLVLLRRLLYQLPRNCLRPIVDGLILSKVRYGLDVFGRVRLAETDAVSREEHMVQVALNDVMRLMCGVKMTDKVSIEKLMERSGIPSLNQMSAQSTLLTAWKIMNGHSPSLTSLVQEVSPKGSGRVTKSQVRRDLLYPRGNAIVRDSFRFRAARIWNSAPMELKNAESVTSAKRLIKNFTKNLPV